MLGVLPVVPLVMFVVSFFVPKRMPVIARVLYVGCALAFALVAYFFGYVGWRALLFGVPLGLAWMYFLNRYTGQATG
jgi:hypothetical protein